MTTMPGKDFYTYGTPPENPGAADNIRQPDILSRDDKLIPTPVRKPNPTERHPSEKGPKPPKRPRTPRGGIHF